MEKSTKPPIAKKNVSKEILQALSSTTTKKEQVSSKKEPVSSKKDSASDDKEATPTSDNETSSSYKEILPIKTKPATDKEKGKKVSKKKEDSTKGNVYEPITTDTIDSTKHVYTKCDHDTLSRAEPSWETHPGKKKKKIQRMPKYLTRCQWKWKMMKWVVVGATLAVLGTVVVVALSVGAAAHTRSQRLSCISESASGPTSDQKLMKTRELPLETKGYTTTMVICTYDDDNEPSADHGSSALHYSPNRLALYCTCSVNSNTLTTAPNPPSTNANMSGPAPRAPPTTTPPACTLRITRCRI